MKRLFFLFLFIPLFFLNVHSLGYGIPRSKDNEPPYPGDAIDELIKKHNAFYIGDRNSNDIYLTFDTGYELGYSNTILDILKEENVKAAFFITGDFINRNPDLVIRMKDEGHLVCNHTLTHPDITKLSYDDLKHELEEVEKLYHDLTGDNLCRYLRPPRGMLSEESLKMTDELGYTQIFWSLAYVDWLTDSQKGKDYAYDSVISRIHNGAIILLHTVSVDNKDALKDIIVKLKENYEFQTLDHLLMRI